MNRLAHSSFTPPPVPHKENRKLNVNTPLVSAQVATSPKRSWASRCVVLITSNQLISISVFVKLRTRISIRQRSPCGKCCTNSAHWKQTSCAQIPAEVLKRCAMTRSCSPKASALQKRLHSGRLVDELVGNLAEGASVCVLEIRHTRWPGKITGFLLTLHQKAPSIKGLKASLFIALTQDTYMWWVSLSTRPEQCCGGRSPWLHGPDPPWALSQNHTLLLWQCQLPYTRLLCYIVIICCYQISLLLPATCLGGWQITPNNRILLGSLFEHFHLPHLEDQLRTSLDSSAKTAWPIFCSSTRRTAKSTRLKIFCFFHWQDVTLKTDSIRADKLKRAGTGNTGLRFVQPCIFLRQEGWLRESCSRFSSENMHELWGQIRVGSRLKCAKTSQVKAIISELCQSVGIIVSNMNQ